MSGVRQFYIEEGFTSHPKIAQAGGDAAWLYVCALDWASQKMTGTIPKKLVSQLSDRRSASRLAQKLVAVGLWHERDDGYEINDWEVRNAKRMNARRKAKDAAHARWEHAPSILQALLDECSTDALEPKNQRTKEPKSMNNPPPLQTADTTRPHTPDEALIGQGLEILYQRRLEARGTPPTNPPAWRRSVLASLRTDHAERLATLPLAIWTAEKLASWLEPANMSPGTRQVHPPRVDCGLCSGSGWTLDESGTAVRCRHVADPASYAPSANPRPSHAATTDTHPTPHPAQETHHAPGNGER